MVKSMVVCCKCKVMVKDKEGGDWFMSERLARDLESIGVSHGFCEQCLSEEFDRISEFQNSMEANQ